tara:strand:- start:1156 stop:1302 length:147 start_codon:yes stop_codon:yes gene_type:complete
MFRLSLDEERELESGDDGNESDPLAGSSSNDKGNIRSSELEASTQGVS